MENKLCSTSEKAGYGGYTTNLSEKFWQEVRKSYPLIDYVGVITKTSKVLLFKNKIKLIFIFILPLPNVTSNEFRDLICTLYKLLPAQKLNPPDITE